MHVGDQNRRVPDTSPPRAGPAGGGQNTSAVTSSEVNMWVGPDTKYLLSVGAKYVPCMRADTRIKTARARERAQQCGVPPLNDTQAAYPCAEGLSGFSCCRLLNGRAGLTDNATCQQYAGASWAPGNVPCDERSGVVVVLRPCCEGFAGRCALRTREECAFYKGVFHETGRLCAEVNCLGPSCDMLYAAGVDADPALPNDVASANQAREAPPPARLGAAFVLGSLSTTATAALVGF